MAGALLALLACLAVGAPARAAAPAAAGPTIEIAQGALRGLAAGAVDKFLGIPYAAPPVGRLRWRAPQPPAAWSSIRPATRRTAPCPQRASAGEPASADENCLYLSVDRPAHVSARSRLPVLFWLHGGGLTSGTANRYDGALLARVDRIVVVSVDYRLGAFGYLALPGLAGGADDRHSEDDGLLDQEAALRWTHQNIGAFGGDPGDVTIAGQGAGGESVCALLAAAPVTGLFSGAIIESGSCESTPQTVAARRARTFAEAAGCRRAARAIACLRGRSAAALLRDPRYPTTLLPVSGGPALPVAPQTAVATGVFDRTPVLIGSDRDEGRTSAERDARASQTGYDRLIEATFGRAAAPQVLTAYPWASYPTPYRSAYALAAATTDSGVADGVGGCATSNLAGEFALWTTTYAYEFDDEHAPALDHRVPGYALGAGDETELAYLWPSFKDGIPLYPRLTPAQRALSLLMVSYWGAFTASGNPNAPGEPLWPDYVGGGALLSLAPDATMALPLSSYETEHQCAFWAALGDREGL